MRRISTNEIKFPSETQENIKILIKKILQLDPLKRPTAKEILSNCLFNNSSINNRKTLKNNFNTNIKNI
jgi:hypothetical protein